MLQLKVCRKDLLLTVLKLMPSVIAMEACGGANYWARTFAGKGFRVKIISPQFVKPFVKSQKNDRNDAEAIVEAAQRKSMRFVSMNTFLQQEIAVELSEKSCAFDFM